MICIQCNNDKFFTRPDTQIEQVFKNELLKVRSTGLVCTNCGWVTVDADRADELRRRTEDAYRKKHGLLINEVINQVEGYIDKHEVARRLGKTTRSVDTYMKKGIVPFYKLGWTVAFKWSEVDEHIKTNFRVNIHEEIKDSSVSQGQT